MEVPTDFWNEVRKELQAVKPELFMLAEASKPELQKEAFDMGYNWPMKDLFSAIAATSGQYSFKGADGKVREFPITHAAAIDSLVMAQEKEYPHDTYLMNMVTNHDLNSWEGTEFERLGTLTEAFAVLSYTLPGMPLIYTGQETGMNRAFEFFEKDKAPQWEPRNEYFSFYQKLNALKHSQQALAAGTAGGEYTSIPVSEEDIIAFERKSGDSRVMVLANLGNKELDFAITGNNKPTTAGMVDYFSGKTAQFPTQLKAGEYRVFVNK